MQRICLTGVTGFIGKNLLNRLEQTEDFEVVALSRKISPEMDGARKNNVIWRRCNGFSLLDVEQATKGVDILVYLIHSMIPSTSLSQGSFADFDLYLADNFARAAAKNGVQKILYLSGIIPEHTSLSTHLQSRLEVEGALAQYGNRVTTLRAGLIVGRNGSSFKILEHLVTRLPIMICPAWTATRCQPIDIEDVLLSMEYCIRHHKSLDRYYDIGGPDVVTYREMLKYTAQALNKRRLFVNFPLFTPALSKLWVAKVTGTPRNLVYPLIDSLKHDMVADRAKQLVIKGHSYKSFRKSLHEGVTRQQDSWMRRIIDYNAQINLRWLENVSSVQRLNIPTRVRAIEVADAYFRWIPIFLRPMIRVTVKEGNVRFFLGPFMLLHLNKSKERSTPDRVVYYLTGGLLTRKPGLNGRLEFRRIESSQVVLVALLDFRPSLPWFVYKFSQAWVHLIIMGRFRLYVSKTFCGI